LVSYGHVFKTKSDSEVIIHGYEQWGHDCIKRFNGMFAFAIWDAGKRQLFLARDRIGIKPLYYCYYDNAFFFASELKAILQNKDVRRDLDYQSISDYLTWQFIPAPETVFRHIKKMLPAHYMVVKEGSVSTRKYWDIHDFPADQGNTKAEEYEDRLRSLLDDSVKKRMISDVPLGAFLSGGIDSSTIVSLMSGHCAQPVETFSIGFDSEEYTDELEYAKVSANAYSTNHHERILTADKLIGLLGKLVWFMDEPFADHSIVPTYLVSELAKENVTVALSGDGGDENFGGYPRRYLFAKNYGRYQRLPGPVQVGIENLLGGLAKTSMLFMSECNRKKKLLKLYDMLQTTGLSRVIELSSTVDANLKKKLLHEDILSQVNLVVSCRQKAGYGLGGPSLIENVFALDVENYLVNDILTKVDRMSMANSLEVRVPLLDHRLVELASSIPVSLKVVKQTTKYILRKTFSRTLPQGVLNRRKQGFGIPIKCWMQNDIIKFIREVLLDASVKRRGLINWKYLEGMISATSTGKCNYARELWVLLMLEMWCHEFLD
ncbi:asparagine synthase (glutamine-hydrolyzing), partial [Candidatus Pacearchaeota archaeon]|nr:asparagine synthase (glutamine-hydrolyzing) [Candidatus Pacearchaeota archaeon]